MSSNQITSARSMNGIIEFDSDNINVQSLTAESITTDDLELKNNLLVNSTNISPTELSYLDNTTSNIQTQLNNKVDLTNVNQSIDGTKTFLNPVVVNGITAGSTTISNFELVQLDNIQSNIQNQLDNKVDLTTSQSIGGNKTFTDQVSLNNTLIVNSTNISPTELSYLDNVSSNIQTQLNSKASLSGTNTYSATQTFNGDVNLNGDLIVANTTISPAELSYLDGLTGNIQDALDQAGLSTDPVMTLNTDQTATGRKTFSLKPNVDGFQYSNNSGSVVGFKSSGTELRVFTETGTFGANSILSGIDANTTIVSGTSLLYTLTTSQPKKNPFITSTYYVNSSQTKLVLRDNTNIVAGGNNPTGFEWDFWNSSTNSTQYNFVDTITGYEITFANQFNLFNEYITFVGYLKSSSEFVSRYPLTDGNFLEGAGLTKPVNIVSGSNNLFTLTSPNPIIPISSSSTLQGYFSSATNFAYYSKTGTPFINNFVDGGTDGAQVSALPTNNITISFNSYVSSVDYMKTGYIYNSTTLYLLDFTDIVVNQGVDDGTNFTLGSNFITNVNFNTITVGSVNVPTSPSYAGYLYSNTELVSPSASQFNTNDFVQHPSISNVLTQVQGITGDIVSINKGPSNTPTPNNKTYTGFSVSATQFNYNNDNTNVATGYFLKDNNIPTPTANHLITAVDTTNKILTTTNLPTTPSSNTYSGYANINTTQIITKTIPSVSVDDGIVSNMNSGNLFVSAVSQNKLSVYGSLITLARQNLTTGYCDGAGSAIVYDPTPILSVGNFLVDYDVGGLPTDAVISSITSLGYDIYDVALTSASNSSFTNTNSNNYNPSYKTAGNKLVYRGVSGDADKVYITGGNYRYIISETNYEYTTNDTGSSSLNSSVVGMNIKLANGNNFFLFGTTNGSGFTDKLLQNNTYVPYSTIPKLSGSIQNSTIQNAMSITNIYNTSNYTHYNYGNLSGGSWSNPKVRNWGTATIVKSGSYYYFLFNLSITSTQPTNNDFIIDTTGRSVFTDILALDNKNTGLLINTSGISGNVPYITYSGSNAPNAESSSSASVVSFVLAQSYKTITNQIIVSCAITLPNGNFYIHRLLSNGYGQRSYVSGRTINVGGTQTLYLDQSLYFGDIGEIWEQTKFYATYSFQYIELIPDTFNIYNNTGGIVVPISQSKYESVAGQNVDIYSSLDSYNSYVSSSFTKITPINFNFYNSETITTEYAVVYRQYTARSIECYTSNDYNISSVIDFTFPSTSSNDEIITRDGTQNVYNKTLYAPSLRTQGSNVPTFPDGIVQMKGLTNYIFYDNQLRIFNNQGSVQNITFSQNETRFFTNVVFDYKIKSPNQPVWYYTSSSGNNQNYGAGSVIGSINSTGGYPLVRYFDSASYYNTSYSPFQPSNGFFYATEGTGVYKIDLYVFCNNATGFNGRISLQTNAGRTQGGQYNMSVNRNTSGENCTLLSWTWTATSTSHYFYVYTHSSVLTAYLGGGHTGLRITKLM